MKSKESETSSLQRKSSNTKRPIFEQINDLDWQKYYGRLDHYIQRLKLPRNYSANAFGEAIERARQAEVYATRLYMQLSQFLTAGQVELSAAKGRYRVKFRSLIRDPEFKTSGITKEERQMYVEAELWEEIEEQEKQKAAIKTLQNYLDCVDKALADIKHTREDIGRMIRAHSTDTEVAGGRVHMG